jgi:hypothetical protein
MVRSTWEEFTAGLSAPDLELLEAYRALVGALPEVEEQVHRTEVRFVRVRVFTIGFIAAHRLELAIDLLRESPLPRLRQAFPTTARVITHRVWLTSVDQLDDYADAIVEAHDTVGRGSRYFGRG